jgi:CheY-like chemotaxis protein/two-component sensor histidine kinase
VTVQLLSLVVERHTFEESLREAAQRKDEFLAALAHELRNPLAPVRHAVEMLQRPDFDTAQLPRTAAMLARQVHQLFRLVDDLLDIHRASRGLIRLQPTQVNLADIVALAVETATAAHGRGDDLEVVLPDQPILLQADPVRLQQVLSNLLANAFKFSDPGSPVCLSVTSEHGEAVLRVRDAGIGIAEHDLRRIFDLFVRIDTSLERSTNGLGIGLSLARQLVQLHGGQLTAHSDGIGRGSEFVVHLPVAATAPPPSLPAAQPQEPDVAPMHVLVVDDNIDAAESLATLLRMMGHRVDVAHDGAQALQVAAQARPAAVLLDIGLPRMNGLEVSRRLRAQPWGREMLLVALTGWSQDADRERSQAAGIDAHLVKPVDLGALMAVLGAGRSAA